jgi:hypothetical protein
LCSAGYEVTYTPAHTFGRKPLYPVLVVKQIHVERCQQRRSEVLEVETTVHTPRLLLSIITLIPAVYRATLTLYSGHTSVLVV